MKVDVPLGRVLQADPPTSVVLVTCVSADGKPNIITLEMDRHGFVNLDELFRKLGDRFQVDKELILEMVEKSERRRFEIVDNKIRALYGHTIPVELEWEEDKTTKVFYHGTTPEAASKILNAGLKPMKRRWVHLSPTIEVATEVGSRRVRNPVILEINAEEARKNGVRFYKATDKVYLCCRVPPEYIKRVKQLAHRSDESS